LNQTVSVKLIAIEAATPDHQQRWISRVLLKRSSVNLQLVANGWAWAAPGFTKPGDTIRTAERKARAAKLGLWQDPNPIAPWDWRHRWRNPTPLRPGQSFITHYHVRVDNGHNFC
jgi:endonuclease YncB( thermonuclease family)